VPELFIENFQTAEDYYNRTVLSSTIRLLRALGLFITVFLPGIAVAVFTYDQEMIPPEFLTTVITATQRTPMPIGAEVFLLVLLFELLREAGTRLPKAVGSAITIVGSLIIGDAAVSAGIVGAPTVIIVALTAVTSFIVPNLQEFTIIYRFILLFLGGTMGLVGIGTGLVVMLTQLSSTETFGIPILSAFSKEEMKDSLVRMPMRWMKFRPPSIAKDNVRRRKKYEKNHF
jgi:spore germination protein KA